MSNRIPTLNVSLLLTRSLRLVVLLLVIVTIVAAAAQQHDGASPWWLELSRYLPYPVFLAPPLLALLLSLALGRWWIGASAMALLLTGVETMDLHWQFRQAELSPGASPLRLMSFNVKAYKAVGRDGGLDALAREVELHHPDILLLQDASDTRGNSFWDAGRPVFGLPNVFIAHQYLVASRLPLRDCELRHTEPTYLDYVRCVVVVDGRPVNLVTAHLVSPRPGLVAARHGGMSGAEEWRENYRQRLLQSRGLTADIENSPRPLILAGDLNAPDASPVVQSLLRTGLRDAFAESGTGYGFSYGQALSLGFSFLRIDHILVSRQVQLLDCFVGNAGTSDHRPVIADLVLPR